MSRPAPRILDTDALRSLRDGAAPSEVSEHWPVVGERTESGGYVVTFAAVGPEGHDVMVHLNGITDRSRTSVGWAIMPRVAGEGDTTVYAQAYELPAELINGYRIVTLPSIPHDVGAHREGWRGVHLAGRPDPLAKLRMPTPLGGDCSVLALPGCREHEAWSAECTPETRRRELPTLEPLTARTDLINSGDDSRVLVLFDAEHWLATGLLEALAQRENAAPLILAVRSGAPAARSAMLPFPARVEEVVDEALLALGGKRPDLADLPRERLLASGQSYGGIAAVGLATTGRRPAARVLGQSCSFHFDELDPDRYDPSAQVAEGSLVRAIRASAADEDAPRSRVDLAAGTEEYDMVDMAKAARSALDAAGHDTTLRVIVGGHDYAWWRHELFFWLDDIAS